MSRRRRILEDENDDQAPSPSSSSPNHLERSGSYAKPSSPVSGTWPDGRGRDKGSNGSPLLQRHHGYLPTYLGRKYFKNVFTDNGGGRFTHTAAVSPRNYSSSNMPSSPFYSKTAATAAAATTTALASSVRAGSINSRGHSWPETDAATSTLRQHPLPMRPYAPIGSASRPVPVDLEESLAKFRENVASTNRLYMQRMSRSSPSETTTRTTRQLLHQSHSMITATSASINAGVATQNGTNVPPSVLHRSASVEAHIAGLDSSYRQSFFPAAASASSPSTASVQDDPRPPPPTSGSSEHGSQGSFWVDKWLSEKNQAEAKLNEVVEAHHKTAKVVCVRLCGTSLSLVRRLHATSKVTMYVPS